MILKDIIDIIESAAPLSYQESWDNSGMQVGNTGTDITAALLTTDITEPVVSEAIDKGCNLIISHHPLLFHPLKHICGLTPQERCVALAIRHGIAIYSSHTAMDSVLHGVSGRMADTLGVTDYRILVPSSENGDYGLGVIGSLPSPMSYAAFLHLVKERFGATYVRYTAPKTDSVQCIAMCGGAGAEFAEEAIRQGADVYLTADCKYHDMQAAAGRIALVDIDHWVSEHFTRNIFQQLLQDKVTTYISEADQTPVHIL